MIGKYIRNAMAGVVDTDEGGVIEFAQDHTGSECNIKISSADGEITQLVVTEKELEMLATIAVLTASASVFDIEENLNDLRDEYVKEQARKREAEAEFGRKMEAAFGPSMPIDLEAAYDEAHRPLTDIYGDPLSGGDGSIGEYYAVEGWGIQKLDSGDFEVTYKV